MANGLWTSVVRRITPARIRQGFPGRVGRVGRAGRTGAGVEPTPAAAPTPAQMPKRMSGQRSGQVPGQVPGRGGQREDQHSDRAYLGDFTGRAKLEYAPEPDGDPDPGEVVWAWVPYEEDHSQGKDRPVLVIARHGDRLLGLMLTSKDHDRDAEQEARHGRFWLDVGSGKWDRQGRPSEVRLDRILQLRPSAVRREGAALERSRYEQVAQAVRRANGW